MKNKIRKSTGERVFDAVNTTLLRLYADYTSK